MTHPSLDHYGVIGDLHTAALVCRDGSIDFCCAPRFDSPAVFAALLDDERGGRWRIAPAGSWTSEQRYLAATNVLAALINTAIILEKVRATGGRVSVAIVPTD